MSNAAITWAWQQKVTPSEKLVLVALADFAHPDTNICWPGQNSIAKMTGQGKRSVVRCMRALEDKGFISRERRHRDDGSRSSDVYTLIIQGATVAHSAKPKCQNDRAKVPNTTNLGARVAPHEPLEEPKEEPLDSARAETQPLPSKKTKNGTRLSEDWTLPFEWREWAALERPDVDVDLEGEKFRDYWIAKAGKAAVKRDWFATWRNWIRNGYAAKRTDNNALKAGLYAAAVAGETPDHGHGTGGSGSGTGRASRRSTLFGDSWARNAEGGVGGGTGDIRAPLKLVAD